MTVSGVISRLKEAGVANANQEALWLTAHALGVGSAGVLARRDDFSPEEAGRIDAVISRRVAGEPLQYILGEADFYGRDFAVGPGVLIPRHDTETIIEGVKKCFARDDEFMFLDWGTGSGCIAITIMLEFPNAEGVMLDVSNDALRYARENVRRYGLAERVNFGDYGGNFALIVSNPPYIPADEIPGLTRDVRDYEPSLALDGGHDGMTYYREILALARIRLRPGGYIILEAGNMSQVKEIEGCGDFVSVGRIYDSGNFPRCLILRRRE